MGGLIESPDVVFEELLSPTFRTEPVWPREVDAAEKKEYCHSETSPVSPVCPAGSRGPCRWSGGASVIHHRLLQRSVPLVWWCLCDTPPSVASAVVGQGLLSPALRYVSCVSRRHS